MLLREKNAVIYGGGGAIGGAVARVFAREGARVFIAGRTQARLDAVAAEIAAAGGAAETAQVDAFDQQAVEKHAAAEQQKQDRAENGYEQGSAYARRWPRPACGWQAQRTAPRYRWHTIALPQ